MKNSRRTDEIKSGRGKHGSVDGFLRGNLFQPAHIDPLTHSHTHTLTHSHTYTPRHTDMHAQEESYQRTLTPRIRTGGRSIVRRCWNDRTALSSSFFLIFLFPFLLLFFSFLIYQARQFCTEEKANGTPATYRRRTWEKAQMRRRPTTNALACTSHWVTIKPSKT